MHMAHMCLSCMHMAGGAPACAKSLQCNRYIYRNPNAHLYARASHDLVMIRSCETLPEVSSRLQLHVGWPGHQMVGWCPKYDHDHC